MPAPSSVPMTQPSSQRDEGIVVIPEQFYGVALKMKVGPYRDPIEAQAIPATPAPAPVAAAPVLPVIQQPATHKRLPMILAVVGIVVAVSGAFVYLNRDLLFKKPTPMPAAVVPPPPIVPPVAPTNLNALVNGQSVSLSWVDSAADETGFLLERRQGTAPYALLTNLAANSTSFLDVTVVAGLAYSYRVSATNSGGDSLPSNEGIATIAALPVPPPPAPTLPPGGLDSDSDGLSDVEEGLFATDLHNPDTDSDGFLDGNELFHLYNPGARAPGRLIESGLVKESVGTVGWSLYIPNTWSTTLNLADGSQATVNTGRDELFKISLQENPTALPIDQWLLQQSSSTAQMATSSLRQMTTKGGLQGWLSPDRLTAAFAWGDKIFTITYDLRGQSFVNLRTLFEMMLNSLHLSGAPVVTSTLTPATSGPGDLLGPTTSTGAEPLAPPSATTNTPISGSSTTTAVTTTTTSSLTTTSTTP